MPDYSETIESLEKCIYDQKQLIEISKALNSTLEYSFLIDAILNISLAQLQTSKAAIFLLPDHDSDYLQIHSDYKGFDVSKKDLKYKLMLNSPLIDFLVKNPKARMTKNFKNKGKSGLGKDFDFLQNLGVQIIAPLAAKGQINGVLVLGEKMTLTDFPEDELEFITSLAGLAGIAVANSKLYELATNDMMTRVKVRHYFQSRLKEEIKKTKSKKQSMSLIFVDVDKFKDVNDKYGHQAGDAVLIEIAGVMMINSRKNDVVARYGGEEFCIILPDTEQSEAFNVAERIRSEVEAMKIKNPVGKNMLQITISLGVTSLKKSDKTNKDIIHRADKALYRAKQTGRNKVICI